MSDKALLIFIKNPQKGKVKTRLAAAVGKDEALSIYYKLIDYTRRVSLDVNADRQIWYSRYIPRNDAWDEKHFTKKQQKGQTLGPRMKHAFEQAFSQGYRKVVIIGSDCGQLQPQHINNAYHALEDHDIAIGPAEDGGYYLLGMRRFFPGLFTGISWSTDRVFTETIRQCQQQNISYFTLQELNDVDTETDWQQVKDRF